MGNTPVKRFLPLFVLVFLLVLVYAMGWNRYISLEALGEHRQWLAEQQAQSPVVFRLGFCLVYIVAVAVSLPGAALLTVLGGLLFGVWEGTVYVVLSATVGASIIFGIVRSSLGAVLAQKAGGWVKRMEEGFRENAVSYLLVLRLVPVFPFWVVNIVPALLNMAFVPYFWVTLVGIVPGSFVYVLLGSGLGDFLEIEGALGAAVLRDPKLLGALVGLAVLSVLPVLYKAIQKRKKTIS